MPHLTLEYTTGLAPTVPFPVLFRRLHDMLAEVGGVAIGNCKSRAAPLAESFVADGTGNGAFVHLELRLLEGRTDDVKRAVGQRALDTLVHAFPPPETGDPPQITVELRDMARAAYFKSPPGTLGTPG